MMTVVSKQRGKIAWCENRHRKTVGSELGALRTAWLCGIDVCIESLTFRVPIHAAPVARA